MITMLVPVDRAHSLHKALLLFTGVTGSSARLLEKQPCLDQVLHGRAPSSATGHFLYSDIYAFGPGPSGPHLQPLPLKSSQPVSPHLCQGNHPYASKYTTSSESPGKTHRHSESVYALSLMNLWFHQDHAFTGPQPAHYHLLGSPCHTTEAPGIIMSPQWLSTHLICKASGPC